MISPAFHLATLRAVAYNKYRKNETQLIRKLIAFNCVYKICSHLGDKSNGGIKRWMAFNGSSFRLSIIETFFFFVNLILFVFPTKCQSPFLERFKM